MHIVKTTAEEGEDGYDPQVFAAMQTRFIVDVQEGTSMIYFLNEEQYQKYQDQGIFPENEEEYTLVKDCQGYQEARLYGITMQEKGVSTLVSVDLIEHDLDK